MVKASYAIIATEGNPILAGHLGDIHEGSTLELSSKGLLNKLF